MPSDHSRLAELVDALHVAVGLRLVAVALLDPEAETSNEHCDLPHLLVVVDDDLPREGAERAGYLARRMPIGSLDATLITLKSPIQFDADPPEVDTGPLAGGRILFDAAGFLAKRITSRPPDRARG